jgi:hypothetical protein
MKIISLLLLVAFLIFTGRDIYLVWFHPDKFIEKTLRRRDKSFPFMQGQPLLFENDNLIKWDRILLPFGFIFVFIIFLIVLMKV